MSNKDYDDTEEKILNEDYKNWKKSVPFLYDMVLTHALHWPSFTFEWLPSLVDDGTVVKTGVLLGSTTDNDSNHVLLGEVCLPSEDDLDPENLAFGTYKCSLGRIELQKRIVHRYAVTRARHMPQNPQIIATTSNHSINIYDTDNKSYNITEDDNEDFATIPETFEEPIIQLDGFKTVNGIISWSSTDGGYVLGSGDCKSIGLWDICGQTGSNNNQSTAAVFNGHTATITDVSWWTLLRTVFLSSSEDCTIGLWDIRSRNHSKPSHSIQGHKRPITSVAASPFSQFVFASSSEDGTMALWDIRNLTVKLHSISYKENETMNNIRWSPHSPNLIASAMSSRTVCVWDLDVLHNVEKLQNIDHNNPPELVFVHGGHSAAIGDFGWHPDVKNVIGSSAIDNIIQIWKPTENLVPSANRPTTSNDITKPIPVAPLVTEEIPQ